MDTRLLQHYEGELGYIREMGAEFAEAYPKIAGRLGMEQLEVLDPYVERLLEGFAFLSARVQLELELQYPVFTQNLLEIVYPHFLAPTPSMTVARLVPDAAQGGLEEGYTVPRGTTLRSRVFEGEQTPCRFTTAHDLTLWPIELVEAEYVDGRSELVAAGLAKHSPAKAALRLRIRRSGGAPLAELPIEQLTLFLTGTAAEPWRLYEAMLSQGMGLAGRSTDRRDDWVEYLGRSIRPRGFEPEEALLPTPGPSFEGYRLLQEYVAMPERFFFVELGGLGRAIRRTAGDDLDLYVLLAEGNPTLKSITAANLDLHAVPAINLFPKRCDRVHVRGTEVDHLVTVDRTAPLDFEIFQLQEVTGISGEGGDDVVVR
ncbi:MAG: type VI secretion system baseplate subunit TssF, partial [Pseudomonadota bacterium]